MLLFLKENVNKDFDAYAKIFCEDPEVCKQRVSKDIENGIDRSNVPPEAIDKQYKNFLTDIDKIKDDGYNIIS